MPEKRIFSPGDLLVSLYTCNVWKDSPEMGGRTSIIASFDSGEMFCYVENFVFVTNGNSFVRVLSKAGPGWIWAVNLEKVSA